MKVRETLEFFRKILLGGDIEKVINELNLQDILDNRISDLSEGQKGRISLAKVFMRGG
ncbi:hypothetical protein HFC64_01095 [Saccharolobus solfataricus]|uniref:Heme ABC transporter n=1 Tax=Saccharolobus solfataricus TaxID=2287 RepID=A0A157T075_SACSO|nr:hypothetical protein [Saccharolobus solfataricus]QPG48760.1 hypothetical protein HFC64_01095 [Saccharolobus solfataricus]SAI84817.1 heme ABC transporter [Saccharolobus solfataricus]